MRVLWIFRKREIEEEIAELTVYMAFLIKFFNSQIRQFENQKQFGLGGASRALRARLYGLA